MGARASGPLAIFRTAGLRPAHVILSAAKDLMAVASGDEILRFAQDDRGLASSLTAIPSSSFDAAG
jgi:hypothetical protein